MPRLWINPIHLVIPSVLLAISLPLTIFAITTTILALIALLVRVIVVYSDVGIVLVTRQLFSFYKEIPTTPQTPLTEHYAHRVEHAKRKFGNPPRKSPSQSSSPTHDQKSFRNSARSDSYASLLGIGIPNRDYEGVGGWRLQLAQENEDLDDSRWINMNSRLELPLGSPLLVTSGPGNSTGKRHKRSLTGSSGRLNGESMKMSPVTSRTPIALSQNDDDMGYFSPNPAGRNSVSRRRSMGMMTVSQGERKSKKGSVESFEHLTNNGK